MREGKVTGSDKAAGYIVSHCPRLGSFAGDSAPQEFLALVAEDISAAEPTALFPSRYKEHVAHAIGMVARHCFLEPPAAIAAVYLATRFEFFFRLLSGKLRGDGTWINQAVDQPAAVAALGTKGLQNRNNQVSDVAVAYKLTKLNRSQPVVRVLDTLENALFTTPTMAVGGFQITTIGDRIAFGRHSAGHGYWGDISAEAVFYGLVTSIIFYNQEAPNTAPG